MFARERKEVSKLVGRIGVTESSHPNDSLELWGHGGYYTFLNNVGNQNGKKCIYVLVKNFFFFINLTFYFVSLPFWERWYSGEK